MTHLFDSIQQPLQQVLSLGIILLSACNKKNQVKTYFSMDFPVQNIRIGSILNKHKQHKSKEENGNSFVVIFHLLFFCLFKNRQKRNKLLWPTASFNQLVFV